MHFRKTLYEDTGDVCFDVDETEFSRFRATLWTVFQENESLKKLFQLQWFQLVGKKIPFNLVFKYNFYWLADGSEGIEARLYCQPANTEEFIFLGNIETSFARQERRYSSFTKRRLVPERERYAFVQTVVENLISLIPKREAEENRKKMLENRTQNHNVVQDGGIRGSPGG